MSIVLLVRTLLEIRGFRIVLQFVHFQMALKSKVALVTGAANGIGKAISIAFVKEGCRVMACDVR